MGTISRHLLPWFKVLLSQAVVIAALWAVRDHLPTSGGVPLAILLLLLQGLVAAALGRMLGLSPFWLPIQVLLPLALAFNAVVPAWAYLVAFAVCVLIYWNSASEQVPLYLTNRQTWAALAALVDEAGARAVVDLGCGMGGVVTHIARTHPGVTACGVETAPLVFLAARLRLAFQRLPNAEIVYRSLWRQDLARYDLVYCFLSPAPMEKLYSKALAEMRPGTLLVSNSFAVPGVTPERVVAVPDARATQLYVYRLPGA